MNRGVLIRGGLRFKKLIQSDTGRVTIMSSFKRDDGEIIIIYLGYHLIQRFLQQRDPFEYTYHVGAVESKSNPNLYIANTFKKQEKYIPPLRVKKTKNYVKVYMGRKPIRALTYTPHEELDPADFYTGLVLPRLPNIKKLHKNYEKPEIRKMLNKYKRALKEVGEAWHRPWKRINSLEEEVLLQAYT